MNYLIIFAHPNGKSFSHEILKTIIEEVKDHGNNFEYRNLYELDFNPVLKNNDLAMYKSGNFPDDVKVEQEWISWANILVFIYPVWWGGMPAILKGYIDRVFASGFAYEYNDNNAQGLLLDKKAFLISTQGYTREYYNKNGMTDAMITIDREGIFNFCGIEMTDHLFFGNAPLLNKEDEQEYLKEVRNTIQRFQN